MKKFKLFASIFAICLFFITGCSNRELKPINSELSLSTFYQEAYLGYNDLQNYDTSTVNASALLLLNEFYAVIFASNDFALALVSAMDFCAWVADENNADAALDTQKIYQYNLAENETEFVVVNKQKGKNVFDTYVYFTNMSDFSEITNLTPNLEYKFEISQNKKTNKFEFEEENKKFMGTVSYDGAALEIDYNFKSKLFVVGQESQVSTKVYFYKGNIYAIRTLVKTQKNNNDMLYGFEYMGKEFYKLCKIGVVKDKNLFFDLKNVEEKDLALPNSGDDYGFKIEFNPNSGITAVPILKPYGIFPSNN